MKTGPKDHTTKLTKHAHKPIVLATKETPEKPTPHVPAASTMDYTKGSKRKGAPAPARANAVRKRAAPLEPAGKQVQWVLSKDV